MELQDENKQTEQLGTEAAQQSAPLPEPATEPENLAGEPENATTESDENPIAEPDEKPAGESDENPTTESENATTESDEKTTESDKKTTAAYVALGLRTALCTFAVLVLLFGSVLTFSPYTAMRFYIKIDNKNMALYNAEKYVRLHDDERKSSALRPMSKYGDALYNCNQLSAYFFNDTLHSKGYAHKDTKFYARKVDKYVTYYLDAPDNRFASRTRKIDEYNLLHTAPALHPLVYSYADSLKVLRFKADYALQNEQLPSYRMTVQQTPAPTYREQLTQDVFEAISGWNEASITESGEWTDAETAQRAPAAFLLFAQLNAYLQAELDALGYYSIPKACDEPDYPENQKYLYPTESDVAKALKSGYSLYGKSPFTLFVVPNLELTNNTPTIFTAVFKDVTSRMPRFIQYIKDHATENAYVADTPGLDPAEHLKYTYYLKSMADFCQSMYSMTAVLSAGTQWFVGESSTGEGLNHTNAEKLRTELKESHNHWRDEIFFVNDARVFDPDINLGEGGLLKKRVSMDVWYRDGLLYDYLAYYKH